MSKTYFIQTFGCQMNHSDSERMAATLDGLGLGQAEDWKNADIIVLNTCSVKQKAEDRINGVVNNIRSMTVNPEATVVLTGCMARRIWDDTANVTNSFQRNYDERVEELKKAFPKVDILIETKDFTKIGDKLGIQRQSKDQPEHYLSFKPKYKSDFQAFVPISTGCNHFCTFCIVPFARGKEVCRPAGEIIREVFDLIKNGYKDITLLGQTVNRWINPDFKNEYDYNEALTRIEGLNTRPMNDNDLEGWREFFEKKLSNNVGAADLPLTMPRDFLQLLQVIDQIPGQWWTTWMSSHPNYMTDELIEFVGNSAGNINKNSLPKGHQRPYLHFALQSGSDIMLKKMNRRHVFNEFLNKVIKIKNEIPNVALSTDIIVGFINETEEDFEKTLEAERLCRFDQIYISEYSPRKGTAAARLKDDVSLNEKARRKNELNDLLRKIAEENNSKLQGTEQLILVDGIEKKTGFLQGRTVHNKETRIIGETNNELMGKFVKVKIINAGPWALEAELIGGI